MTEYAVYTPTPNKIHVVVFSDVYGRVHASSAPAHLVSLDGDIIGEEDATVVSRGNLLDNGHKRWFGVELADGSMHMVIGEGS